MSVPLATIVTMTATPPHPTPEAGDPGCGCLCYSLHPDTCDQCLHTGQVPVTLTAARASRTYPARVKACGPVRREPPPTSEAPTEQAT